MIQQLYLVPDSVQINKINQNHIYNSHLKTIFLLSHISEQMLQNKIVQDLKHTYTGGVYNAIS